MSITELEPQPVPPIDQAGGEPKPPSDVDVLIIGAGPAGLMAAACLTRYGVHNIRLVDKRSHKIFTGHADGFNGRSMEIFQALGLGPQLMSEGCRLNEMCFWNPDENGNIKRTGRGPNTTPGLARFSPSTIHQGRIERMLLDKIALWSTPARHTIQKRYKPLVSVERGVCPETLTLPHLGASALSESVEDRILVRLRHLTESEAQQTQIPIPVSEIVQPTSVIEEDDLLDALPKTYPSEEIIEEVRCKYIIGTDGAKSWTRSTLGIKLEGESANFFWGVIEGIPATDFPDIRSRCAIHSAENGSVMVIPRERDMVRLYIQLPQPEPGQRPNRSDITPEKLLQSANAILAPYTIEIPEIEWYTCYEIGQRLADRWSWNDRIFIAGDACHTHSPKSGQGMNVSMADTFNLAWKLAHVLQQKSHPDILKTYESERGRVAAELIEFDRKFSRLFSGKPAKSVADENGISLEEFHNTFLIGCRFVSGTSVDYQPSLLIAKDGSPHQGIQSKPELATQITLGCRLYSHKVIGLADGSSYHVGDLAPADGKWRLLLFGGDIAGSTGCKARFDKLADFLGHSDMSPLLRYTPPGADSDALIDCITIVASPRSTIESDQFPDILRPKKGKYGIRAYRKIFTDEASYHDGHGKAYENYGIDPQVGCVVIVRPDQHVSFLTSVDDHGGISSFFDAFMLRPSDQASKTD